MVKESSCCSGNKSVYKIPENLRKYYISKKIKDKT